jgi:hypothetical protein
MLGQHHAGLHDVQLLHHRGVDFREPSGKEVRLLLVVALKAQPGRLDV